MPTTSFMPTDDAGKAELLEHLVVVLPRYAALLNLSDELLDTLKADAASFRYALNGMDSYQSFAHYWTSLKNLLRDGGSGSTLWPQPPALAEPVPPPGNAGIVTRLYALRAYIVAQQNYTAAIGQETWLIGYAQTVDPGSWKPVLSGQVKAGHPVLAWIKGKASALEIWSDYGNGKDFSLLTISTSPNTTDPTPPPPSGTSVLRRYKAIYRLHDQQVGQWSDVITVMVEG